MDAFNINLKEEPLIFWVKILFKIIIEHKYFHVDDYFITILCIKDHPRENHPYPGGVN